MLADSFVHCCRYSNWQIFERAHHLDCYFCDCEVTANKDCESVFPAIGAANKDCKSDFLAIGAANRDCGSDFLVAGSP